MKVSLMFSSKGSRLQSVFANELVKPFLLLLSMLSSLFKESLYFIKYVLLLHEFQNECIDTNVKL